MSTNTLAVGIKFEADTTQAISGNQAILDSLKEISESLKAMAANSVSAAQEAVHGATKTAKANKEVSESTKQHTGLLNSLKTTIKQTFVDFVNEAGKFSVYLNNLSTTVTALVTPFEKVVTIGADFEAKMSTIGAVSDATDAQLAGLGGTMRKLAAESVFSASEVGEAGLNLAKAGFTVQETISALPGVLSLAAASGEDLATVSEIAAAQLRAFKLETKEMSMVADLFTKAANSSNVSVGDLGESMKYCGPVFNAAGQSILTTVAATSMLSNIAIKGSQAGTAMRMAMLRLAGPPKKAAEALDYYGVKVEEVGGDIEKFSEEMEAGQQALESIGVKSTDSKGKIRDFADILMDLNKGMQNLGEAKKLETVSRIFGVEATSSMIELISQSKEFEKTVIKEGKAITYTTTAFKEFRKNVDDNQGFAEQSAKKMLANLKGDWNQFTGNLEELAISIYNIIVPMLRPLVQLGTQGIQAITLVAQGIMPVISAFNESFLAGIAPIKEVFSGLSVVFAPIIQELADLFGTGVSTAQTFETIKTVASTTGQVLGEVARIGITPLVEAFKLIALIAPPIVTAFIDIGKAIGETLAKLTLGFDFSNITGSVEQLGDVITNFRTSLNTAWEGIGDVLSSPFQLFSNIVTTVESTIANIKSAFASGDWAGIGTAISSGVVSGFSNLGQAVSDVFFGVIKMAIEPLKVMIPTDWIDGAINSINSLKASLEPIAPVIGAIASAYAYVIGGSMIVSGIGSIVTALYAMAAAGRVAAASITKIQLAGNLLAAFFAGWSIGTYLWNEFEMVRVIGYETVGGLLKGFEGLKYGVEVFSINTQMQFNLVKEVFSGVYNDMYSVATIMMGNLEKGWAYLATTFSSLMQTMQGLWQSFVAFLLEKMMTVVDKLSGLTSSVDFLPGMTDATAKLQGFAMNLSIAAKQAENASQATVDYTGEYNKQVTVIEKTVDAQLESVKSSKKASEANKQLGASLKQSAQEYERNIKAIAESQADLVKSSNQPIKPKLATTAITESPLSKDLVVESTRELETAPGPERLSSNELKEEKDAQKKALKEKESLKQSLKEEKNLMQDQAHDLTEIAKQQAEAIKESSITQAESVKDSAIQQAESLKGLADKYKESAKAMKQYSDDLEKSRKSLSGMQVDMATSGMNEKDKTVFTAYTSDQGDQYGAVVAQTKMLTSANQELTKAKEELTKATMSETQAKLFDLQQKYPEAIAAEIFQTQELAKQKKSIADLNKQLDASTLNTKQGEYVELIRKVGVEEAGNYIRRKQMIEQQGKLRTESEAYWNTLSDKAGEYYEKFKTGQLSAGQSIKGFFKSVLEEQQKAALDASKKKFLGLFGLDKEANQKNQVQKDLDIAAKFLADSNEGVKNSAKDASGTIAKAITDTGDKLGAIVTTLGKEVADTLNKSKDLESKAKGLEDQSAGLKDTANKAFGEIKDLTGKAASAITYELKKDASRMTAGGYSGGGTSSGGIGEASGVPAVTHQVVKTSDAVVSSNQKYVKVTNEVANALASASKKFNYSLLELSRMASLESSFNAKVKNSIGYMGLFQFKGAASKEVGISGREYDPRAAAEGAIKYWQINQKTLDKTAAGWRETASTKGIQEGLLAWMAHNQGAGGLGQVLKTLTTGVNKMSAEVTRNVRNNMQGGEGKGLSGVALAQKYMEGWIAKWNKLPLPEQFKSEFQGEVGKGVVTVTTKASEESAKVASKTIKESVTQSSASGGVAIQGKTLDVLSETTNKYIQKGVSYQLGAKNIELGKIDCSGWVNLLTKTAFEKINQEAGKTVFDKKAFQALQGSSHNMIQSVADKTGYMVDSRKTANFGGQLKEGMMIGLDKGDHGWDRGRVRAGSAIDKNIDHIVQVTVDKVTGKLGISESHSVRKGGKQVGGVAWTEMDKWLEKNKKVTMFAVDPFKMAAEATGKALTQVAKAAEDTTSAVTEQAKTANLQAEAQAKSTDLQAQAAAKQTEISTATTAAGQLELLAKQELANTDKQIHLDKVATAASYEQAMAAVEASRIASATQDATAMLTHADNSQAAGQSIIQTADEASKQVTDVAGQAQEGLATAAGQCLAEATNNPAIQNAADLKEATDVMEDTCAGKSEGIMGMFSGLTDKIGGFFSNITGSLGNMFGGGKEGGGFLSSISNGISSLFGGGGKEGGGFMSTITKGIGSLFGGGDSKGGGIMSTITGGIGKLFSGGGEGGGLMSTITKGLGSLFGGGGKGGDLMGSLTKGLGGLLGGSGEATKFISGLTENLGGLTGALGPVGKGISSLLGGGSTPGMGALSATMSLLSGDMAGAASGAASLLASMTPLGPVGGMIAGQLMKMSGIGAKWVREAEWVQVSMKGMSAEFSKGFRETKKGWIGGGSRTKTESLDEASIKKLSDMLGETKKSIEAVSESLGMDKNGLLGNMDNFRYHIAAMEDKGPEWFDKAFEKMRVAMVKSAVDNIMVAGEDVKTNLGGNFKNTFKQVLDGTFNEAARAETWDGALTKFVSTADAALKGGIQDDVSTKLGERLTEFVTSSASQFENMPIEELQGALNGEIGKIFTDLTGIAIPESITGELATVFASRIQDAIQLSQGQEITGPAKSAVVTDKGESKFYTTLKGMVSSFEGTEQELTAFIGKMMETKDIFKQTGLSMTVFSEDLIKGFDGIDKFSASIGFFKDNFASAASTNIAFSNSLTGLNKSMKDLQTQTLPGINTTFPSTREEFYKLTQSVSALGKDGEKTFATLLKGAPQFDAYYKAIEDFNQKFGGASGVSVKTQAKKVGELNTMVADAFKKLGLELPKTRKGLFDLVQGFDLTDNSQRALHDSILNLAPAFDELFSNTEQVDKFRESMRGIYDGTGGAEKTIADLAKQFPDLNLGATALTLNTKEAARSLATMSDGELLAWAESMGLTGLSIEDITQKTTDYLSAATELQKNVGSFKDEMHKIATGATDNEAALAKLTEKYPMLSESLNTAGMTATKVAGYFDQMSPDELSAMAATLGVTVETLMADTQTYIGILQAQSNIFSSINGESLGGDLMKSMTDANVTSAQEAGQSFASTFVSQFENQMVSSVLNSVMQTIYQGVVEPFLASSAQAALNISEGGLIAGSNLSEGAAVAGSNLSLGGTAGATASATGGQMAASAMATGGMLAGDALAKIVEDAKQKIMIMGQVMTELKSSGVMDQITSSLSSVGETAYSTFSTAAPTLFQSAASKETTQSDQVQEPERVVKEAEDKSAKEAEAIAKDNQDAVEEAKSTAEDAKKIFTDFSKGLNDLSSGLEGNAKTINELKTTYKNTTVEQMLVGRSSKDMIDQLKGMSEAQLKGVAQSSGVELSKLSADLLNLVEITKQSEKAMGDFRNKMAVLGGGATEYQQTIDKIKTQYSGLDEVFTNQGLTAKELATQLSAMDDTQLQAIASNLGVTVDQFMADSESYITALKSQEEALKSQADSIKSFRDSLEEIANPDQAGSKQKAIGDLDQEFAGLGLAAKAMTIDAKAAAQAMLSMPDDQLIAFAEQYGLTTDQLKEKTTAYFGAVNELQQGMDSWRGKMSQMVSGESEASINVSNLKQKSPYLGELTQGMDSKAMAGLFSGMDNTQIEQLAKQYGVSIEKFEADTESWVTSTKTMEDEAKTLAQGFTDFRTKMMQIATGTSDAQVSLDKLTSTYGGYNEVQGKSSKELATYFSTLSDADLTAQAARFGVTTDQFKADAENLVTSTQSIEEVTKSQANSMKEFRDSLLLMSGSMNENEVSLKNLREKYPSLSSVINDQSLTAKQAAEQLNSLSDDQLKELATSLGTDFDTLKADTGTWLGIIKQQDDALKESAKSINDFQNEMRKTAGAANDSQITMEGLTEKYPALSSVINDSSISAKEAASQFASMDMQALMDQLGIVPEKQAEFIADSQAWVGQLASNDEAIKASQEAALSYHDTMLKATGTYGENDIALKNLTSTYPSLSSALMDASLSAKDAANYFANMSEADLEAMAKSLGVSIEKLRTDSESWVGIVAANDEAFNSFNSSMLKLKTGMSDNEMTLQSLANQYPSLSQQILNSGQTAEQAAGLFANMSETDLEALAKSLGVSVDKLRTDMQNLTTALPSGQIFKDLRTSLSDLINPLQGAEKTIDDLAAKYPQLNLATNALGINVTDAAKAIQGMTDDEMVTWAKNNGIAAEDATAATVAYLGAVKELQTQIGGFKDRMHQLATGMSDNDASLDSLKKKYPALNKVFEDSGMTAQKVAQQFDAMSAQQIADTAKSLGVSVEELMADTDKYIGILTAQDEATKAQNEKLTGFREEMSKLTTTMTDNERALINLNDRYPEMVASLTQLGTTSKDVAQNLLALPNEQLESMAKASKMTTDQFLDNATQYVNTLNAQEADTKAAITSVKGMQTEFRKMTSGLTDSQFAIAEVTTKYPKLISSMGLSGKTAEDVASQFANMSPESVVEMAKGLGVTTDEFIGDVNSYVGALRTMGDEAKAVRDSLLGFKDEMAKMGTNLSDNEFTLNNLSTKFPSLTNQLNRLGTDSKSVANALANMDVGQLEKMAASMNLKPEEFISNSSAYISALKARDDEVAKNAEEAATKAQEEATKAAEKTQTELMKQVDKFFSAFDKLAEKISTVSNDIVTDIQSLDSTDDNVLAARRAAKMENLQGSINSLQGYDLNKEIGKDSTKDMEKAVENVGKYRKLLADETKYRIDQINKEKDELQKAHEKIAADFAKFVDSLSSLSGTIGDDVAKLNEEIGGGLSKADVKEKSKGEFTLAKATALTSTAKINPYATLGTITQTNTEALQGVSPDDIQKTSAANMAISKAVVDSIKSAQLAGGEAVVDAEKAVKLADEYHKNILSALDEQIADINKKGDADKKAIEDAAEVKTKSLEKERDDNVKALEKKRDDSIKALEKERDDNLKESEAKQKAAKELMELLTKIKESATKLKESVASDMESLRKDMQLPGTTAGEQLSAIAGKISASMPATDDSIKTLEKYKDLVNESLKEQIDAENKKFEDIKKTQDLQRDHYKKLIDFSKQLKGFVDDLKLGELSYYNPQRRLEESKRQYEETLTKAKGGDETAMGEVTGKAQTYLKEAQDFYASSSDYTNIFEEVNKNMADMKDVADSQAEEIARQVPIDETETGKHVANLLPLQQAALEKLQLVDGILGTMDKSLTQQLLSPAATPMPDDQFSKMQDDTKQRFDDLIEKQKTNADDLIEKQKTNTDDLIKQATTDRDQQIAASQANTDKLVIAAKEAAKVELLTLNESVVSLKTAFEAEAEKTFDDTAFAGMVTATQQASLAQLMQLGNYIIAMDAGLKDSLKTNIEALMSQLSPENQLIVAERLDEAMQRNITGPLYELIGAVKGESVKKANAEKEKAADKNKETLAAYMDAFAAYEKEAKAQNVTASFDVIASKLSELVKTTQVKDSSSLSGYRSNLNGGDIDKLLAEVGIKFTPNENSGTSSLETKLSGLFMTAATQTNGAWNDFKASYLASNQQLLGMFKADIGTPLADQLAQYKKLMATIPQIEQAIKDVSTVKELKLKDSGDGYKDLTGVQTYGFQVIKDLTGMQVKSMDDVKKAQDILQQSKETFAQLKQSVVGITSLNPEIDGLNKKLAETKTSIAGVPKIDFGKSSKETSPSLLSYLPAATGTGSNPQVPSAVTMPDFSNVTNISNKNTVTLVESIKSLGKELSDKMTLLNNGFVELFKTDSGYWFSMATKWHLEVISKLEGVRLLLTDNQTALIEFLSATFLNLGVVLQTEIDNTLALKADLVAQLLLLKTGQQLFEEAYKKDVLALSKETSEFQKAYQERVLDFEMRLAVQRTELLKLFISTETKLSTALVAVKEAITAHLSETKSILAENASLAKSAASAAAATAATESATAAKESTSTDSAKPVATKTTAAPATDSKANGSKPKASFDVGTANVPSDMTANIHRGEIIIDPRSSDVLRRYGVPVTVNNNGNAEKIDMSEVVSLLKTLIAATQDNGDRIERVESTVDSLESRVGDKIKREIQKGNNITVRG